MARCSLLLALSLAFGAGAQKGEGPALRTLIDSGPSKRCVDVLVVGDGYTAVDLGSNGKFWQDTTRISQRLLATAPFSGYGDRFNVHALPLESAQAGCDPARDRDEVDTALDCAFDSADGRVLTVGDERRLEKLVRDAGQVDLVLVMVNIDRYGGAGSVIEELPVRGRPCPSPTFAASDADSFLIALHELGHSFAGLADEYEDTTMHERYPIPEVGDVPAANASLPRCFDRSSPAKLRRTIKWGHFLSLPGADARPWLHEGAYYRAAGVFRPWEKCRMRSQGEPYCPVCAEEISKAILDACGVRWNDKAWHEKHPLVDWLG